MGGENNEYEYEYEYDFLQTCILQISNINIFWTNANADVLEEGNTEKLACCYCNLRMMQVMPVLLSLYLLSISNLTITLFALDEPQWWYDLFYFKF